jgi:TPR repeat protein
VANNELDNLFQQGKDAETAEDYEQAAHVFRKMLELGDPAAQAYMGTLCETGEGVPQDYAQAAEWYAKAAAQGNAEAQESLDKLKAEGKI